MAPELGVGVSFWVTAWAMGGLSVDRPKTIEKSPFQYIFLSTIQHQHNLTGYDTHFYFQPVNVIFDSF